MARSPRIAKAGGTGPGVITEAAAAPRAAAGRDLLEREEARAARRAAGAVDHVAGRVAG